MSKKKKYTLDFDEPEAYIMIGLSSHHPDYRLAWNINEVLDLQLEKADEWFYLVNKKGVTLSFHPYFLYLDEENLTQYYLIKNKHEGKYLTPEKPMLDYLFFSTNQFLLSEEEIIAKLKKGSSILGVFSLNSKELKSTENIIFD